MSVFEDILKEIDLSKEVYKILGLPDPEKYPEVDQPLASPTITTWFYANKMLVGMGVVIVVLVIFLLTLK